LVLLSRVRLFLLLFLLLDSVIVLMVWGCGCLEGEEKAPVDAATPVTFTLLDFETLVGFAAQDILEVNLLDPGLIVVYSLFS